MECATTVLGLCVVAGVNRVFIQSMCAKLLAVIHIACTAIHACIFTSISPLFFFYQHLILAFFSLPLKLNDSMLDGVRGEEVKGYKAVSALEC